MNIVRGQIHVANPIIERRLSNDLTKTFGQFEHPLPLTTINERLLHSLKLFVQECGGRIFFAGQVRSERISSSVYERGRLAKEHIRAFVGSWLCPFRPFKQNSYTCLTIQDKSLQMMAIASYDGMCNWSTVPDQVEREIYFPLHFWRRF
jgi:hypothetical protein